MAVNRWLVLLHRQLRPSRDGVSSWSLWLMSSLKSILFSAGLPPPPQTLFIMSPTSFDSLWAACFYCLRRIQWDGVNVQLRRLRGLEIKQTHLWFNPGGLEDKELQSCEHTVFEIHREALDITPGWNDTVRLFLESKWRKRTSIKHSQERQNKERSRLPNKVIHHAAKRGANWEGRALDGQWDRLNKILDQVSSETLHFPIWVRWYA